MVISEVQVLDGVKSEPFDLKIALPVDDGVGSWRPRVVRMRTSEAISCRVCRLAFVAAMIRS